MYCYCRRGTKPYLFSDNVGKTLEQVFETQIPDQFDWLEQTERAVVYFDYMHMIGHNSIKSGDKLEENRLRILEEIEAMISGTYITLRIKRKKPEGAEDSNSVQEGAEEGYESYESVEGDYELVKVKTQKMFFICFGCNDRLIPDEGQDEVESTNSRKCSPNTSSEASRRSSNHSTDSSGGNKDSKLTDQIKNLKSNKMCDLSPQSTSSLDSYFDDDYYDELDECEYWIIVNSIIYVMSIWILSILVELNNRMAKKVIEGKNSPIPEVLALWGMSDVELKFAPEALEIMGNQVIMSRTINYLY